MKLRGTVLLLLLTASVACGSGAKSGSNSNYSSSRFTEGKDFFVLERARFNDEMGFDRPVEAMSVLLPRGWKAEGGVVWRGFNECRAEMISWKMTATSADGAIRMDVPPLRSFVWSQDPMIQRANQQAASNGGCAISRPMEARDYLQSYAREDLGGATVSDIRTDETLMGVIKRLNDQGNAVSREFNNGIVNSGTAVFGTLKWPDGTEGLANIGVLVGIKDSRDMFTGRPNGFAVTTVFHRAVIRFPAARKEEAIRIFGTVLSSHRVNPVWQKAKDDFVMRLSSIEHKGNMDRIRLAGEQAAAYAKSADAASEARMRSWENQNAASDRIQHRFIQTIREVETWKTTDGNPVELSAGYHHAWSRPDGSYILTNNSLFDPAVEFQQNWTRMEKAKDK